MDDTGRRSVLEKYGQAVFGLVFGLVGLFVAEVVMHEVWPTFVGLALGLTLGTVVSLLLMRRRRAQIGPSSGEAG